TMVIFSGDLDKAIASFIIATGSAAMGNEVTMFFTFWGLNMLRKAERVPAKKTFMEKMFGRMMPRGPEKLSMSKMNMGGLGAILMKSIMRKKNIATLQELMATAQELGVKMIACTMSMDVLGITEAELIDSIDYAGVATYLMAADESKLNLFI
ncbi:MAG: DsrE/DsrF/DrsH-like family protein, partial [Tumebacillaceae bacterium]